MRDEDAQANLACRFPHSFRAIQVTEEAIPTQTDDVDYQNAMLEWYKLEIDCLNRWPKHPVCFETLEIALVQLRLWITPL